MTPRTAVTTTLCSTRYGHRCVGLSFAVAIMPVYYWFHVTKFTHILHTVYPKKYAHGFCFAMLCCGYTLTDFPISIRLTSLALWRSNCPSDSKATLMNMDKYFMWIHYERLYNHNKVKHNKTVCIFLGIYCNCWWGNKNGSWENRPVTKQTITQAKHNKALTNSPLEHALCEYHFSLLESKVLGVRLPGVVTLCENVYSQEISQTRCRSSVFIALIDLLIIFIFSDSALYYTTFDEIYSHSFGKKNKQTKKPKTTKQAKNTYWCC